MNKKVITKIMIIIVCLLVISGNPIFAMLSADGAGIMQKYHIQIAGCILVIPAYKSAVYG